jgi:glycolate oxidase iron-sulfur subunit
MSPSIDAATARVLDAVGVQSIIAPGSGCCGAIRQHLDDQAGARDNFRRNIDAWWPLIESAEVQAILINASGCGAMVAQYAHLLSDDPAYADKAKRVVELARDVAEFLPQAITAAGIGVPDASDAKVAPFASGAGAPPSKAPQPARPGTTFGNRTIRVAFHPPCTLQHGLKIRGKVEAMLVALGAELVPVRDTHLCCGSAGTYSLLQTELSQTLRARKLDTLLENRPQMVLSANIGCIAHLQSATETPVRHWVEWVDEALSQRTRL